MFEPHWFVWAGIVLCVSQSAMFSGLNLAFFSVSRLRLEAEAQHNVRAQTVLNMRLDSNYLLTTILWGNVASNTLLALLSNSVMTGVAAFVTSTLIITFFGEICPQAYFSRRALQTAARFAPVLRFYQLLLLPVAKPTARLLDLWLGYETIEYMREKTLRNIILRHMEHSDAEINQVEGHGAMNFMDLDDNPVGDEGQPVTDSSIIPLSEWGGGPGLPAYSNTPSDPLLRRIHASGMKWVVLTEASGEPRLLLNADEFLRDAVFSDPPVALESYCHPPILIRDSTTPIGEVIAMIKYRTGDHEGQPIEHDVALVWNDLHKRVITGSDILADLLRGVRQPAVAD